MPGYGKIFYSPEDYTTPTIVNFGGELFIFNDRDAPKVLNKHDTTQLYNMGTRAPSGFDVSVVAGGPAENADQSFLVRWRWRIASNGYISNPTSGSAFDTTAGNQAIVMNVHPEPVYGSGKYDQIQIEMTRPGGAEFYIHSISGMPTGDATWQISTIRSTEGTFRVHPSFGHTPPRPSFGRVVHNHRGKLWSCDQVNETKGTAMVLDGNRSVVSGLNVEWGVWASGRLFAMEGSGVTRTITRVDEPSGIILDSDYADQGASGNYIIFPSDPSVVRYSLTNLPESWNEDGNFERVMVDNNDKPHAFASYFNTLLIYGEHTTIAWTYDIEPRLGEIQNVSTTRGAINHECVVEVNNALFSLDHQGVWAYNSAQVFHLSRPINEIIFGRAAGWEGIDWDKSAQFRAVHNEERKEVIWWVALNRTDEDKDVQRGLVYRYEDDIWGLYETIPVVKCAALLPNDNNILTPVIGTSGSNLWFFDENTTDGVPLNTTTSGLVGAGSSTTQIFFDGGDLYTDDDGLAGVAIVVDGVGSGLIDSNTISTIDLTEALPSTPAEGTLVKLGPIETLIKTSFRTIPPHEVEYVEPKDLYIRYIPTASTYNLRVKFFFDYNGNPEVFDSPNNLDYTDVDVSTSGGLLKIPIPKKAVRRLAISIENFEPANPFQITRMSFDGNIAGDEVVF